MQNWFSTQLRLPKSGTIVEIKIRRKKSCSCGGYEKRECYFEDETFFGVENRKYVDFWRVSPANDLIKELEEKKKVIAKDCRLCVN